MYHIENFNTRFQLAHKDESEFIQIPPKIGNHYIDIYKEFIT